MSKRLFTIILILGATTLLSAQGLYVEPALRYSYHIPFPDYADYPVYGADLRIGRQTDGNHEWERFFNYPSFGLDLRFEHHTLKDYFDEQSQQFIDLGNCYSVFGYCNGHLINRPKFQFDYTWGGGLSFWPNYGNRLISTPVTVHLNLDFGPVFRINDHWDLLVRAVFSHASNGAIKVPNKGVNVLGGQIGVRCFPKGRVSAVAYADDSIFRKSNAIYVLNGIGFYESTSVDDLYCIGNTFQVGYTRSFHRCFRYGGGIDVLFSGENKAMYAVNNASEHFRTFDYFGIAPFASFDILYGDFVFHLSAAYYLWQPAEYLPKGYQKYYERLAFHYHFGPQKRFFAGVGMKVHRDCIDYIEWTVGANLWKW
jgi:hypothetical protein